MITETLAKASKALLSPDGCQGVVFWNDAIARGLDRFRKVLVDEVVAEDFGRPAFKTCKVDPIKARYVRLADLDDFAVGPDGRVLRRDAKTRVWTLIEPSVSKEDGHLYVRVGVRLRYHLAKLELNTFAEEAPQATGPG